MELEKRIAIAEWAFKSHNEKGCYDSYNIGQGYELVHRNLLFTEASHFEALRQVLREREYHFIHVRNEFFKEIIQIFKRNNTPLFSKADVINGDEHTPWLEAVDQLIEKEKA